MKPFKISYQGKPKSKFSRWIDWISMIFGIILSGYSVYEYFFGLDTSESISHFIFGIFLFIWGYNSLNEDIPSYPDITIKEAGIECTEHEKTRFLAWPHIKSVYISNNKIAVQLEDNQEEELDIGYLGYNELQMVKKKLKFITPKKDVAYSSKY